MALTPTTVFRGFPPTEGYKPEKEDIIAFLTGLQTIAAGGAFSAVDVTLAALPLTGNTPGQLGLVLSENSDGGVYRWNGASWQYVSALPFILGGETYTQLAQAAATALETVAYHRSGRFIGVAGQTDYSLVANPMRADQIQIMRQGQVLDFATQYTVEVVGGAPVLRLAFAPAFSGEVFTYIIAQRSVLPPDTPFTFATYAELVTEIATNGAIAGRYYVADGLMYFAPPVGHVEFGTNPIPDAAGLIPSGNVYAEHFGPIDGVNDQVQIRAAFEYVDSIGGGDVHLRAREYVISIDGTYETGTDETVNGDRNACLKLNSVNRVILRGQGPDVTIIRQVGTEVAHGMRFGTRSEVGGVGNISCNGGATGFTFIGNRTTAVDVGTRFMGGSGITARVVTGEVGTIILDDFECIDAFGYGVGAQRAAWKDSRITNFKIIRPGNDGLDAKYDANADGESNNYIAHGFVKDHSMRGALLDGPRKAGVDIRDGWSAYDIEIDCANPGASGFRLLTSDNGIPGSDENAPNRSQVNNIRVKMVPGSVTYTPPEGDPVVKLSAGFEFTTSRGQGSNLYAEGAAYNYWITGGVGGHKLTNITGRNAGVTNLYLNAPVDTDMDDCQFIGVEMVGAGSGQDIRITGGGAPNGTQIIGVKAGTIQIDAGAINTMIVGEYTTLTDSGTNTRVIRAAASPQRIGRNATQHILIDGNGSLNRILGVSVSGVGKHLRLEADANSLDVQINAAAAEQVVSLRTQNVERAQINALGLQIPSAFALMQNARILRLGVSGSPEGVISAPVGSFYTRSDGGTGTTLYVKESGSGNTGWVAK